MPINTLLAYAASAVLLFGPAGTNAMRQNAQLPVDATHQATVQQTTTQQPAACADDSDDAVETDSSATDGDSKEVQCGDQNAPDAADAGAEGDNETEAAASDQNDAAPNAAPAITAAQAQATAEAQLKAGAASKVELDDENGQLVYSVEIGSSDVKVDAMTGTIISVESGEDVAGADQDQVEEGDQNSPDNDNELPEVGAQG